MWNKFPILSILAVAGLGTLIAAQIPLFGQARPASPLAEQQSTDSDASGDALLASTIASLENGRPVSAKVRQTVDLFGQRLFGAGEYLQQGRGVRRRFRLELSLQLTAGKGTRIHTSDGHVLWLYTAGESGKSLHFVNLRRVHEYLDRATPQRLPPGGLSGLLFGGLPEMLRALGTHFDFESPAAVRLGEVPLTRLRGTWKSDSLAVLSADQRKAFRSDAATDPAHAVAHLPTEVVLYLGPRDLFPYRIEFRRSKTERGRSNKRVVTIAAIEFLDVRFDSPIDESRFGRPADLPETDYTDAYLARMGIAAKVE